VRSWTVRGLAKELGVSPAMVGRWRGGELPKSTNLRSLARSLNVTTDYLLGLRASEQSAAQNDEAARIASRLVELAPSLEASVRQVPDLMETMRGAEDMLDRLRRLDAGSETAADLLPRLTELLDHARRWQTEPNS
jgi:transcriptional regulator with XRE-family HTH domain